jgi:hypothetical protein
MVFGSRSGRSRMAYAEDDHDKDYRHFDSIIWQLPAWASAIYAFTVVGCSQIISNDQNLQRIFGISSRELLVLFLNMVSVLYLLLYYVLYRFRMNQARVKPPIQAGGKLFGCISGQVALQLIIAIEGSSLFCVVLLLYCGKYLYCILLAVVFLEVVAEGFIRNEKKLRERIESTENIPTSEKGKSVDDQDTPIPSDMYPGVLGTETPSNDG